MHAGRIARDERGISAVVAVVALIGIFAGATLSVDAGNLWQTRRNMITATDASALGEAGELAFSSSTACTGLYNAVLERNAGTDVTDRECTVVRNPSGTGYVMVEGRKPVSVRFGVVLGLGDTAAYSMSAAMFGSPTSARALRPIAYCKENLHVKTWLDLKNDVITQAQYDALRGIGDYNDDGRIDFPASGPPQGSYASFGVVHRMYWERSIDDGACGEFDGNWGWLDFDGGGSGLPGQRETEINQWLRDGYQAPVRIRTDSGACPGTPGGGDAESAAEGCVSGEPGSLANSMQPGLNSILNKPIHILIIDSGACTGGGSTCLLDSWAFLGVILRGYQVTGANAGRYFDFEFTDIQISGGCCQPVPLNGDTGVRSVALCAVDHDAFDIDADERCGAVLS